MSCLSHTCHLSLFSAYNGIDEETSLKNIEVLCSLRIEWLGAVNASDAVTDKQSYARCEIIEPKFASKYEYSDYEGETSIIGGLPLTFGRCKQL